MSPSRPRVVVGIDHASNRIHLVGSEGLVLAIRAQGDPDERRHQLFLGAKAAFERMAPGTLLVVEEPITGRNGKTTRLLCLLAGALWAAHLEYSLFWAWTDIAHWKKEVIGNGNATKEQIEQWVKANLHMTFADSDPDFYDAACLMHYGCMKLERSGAIVADHG